MITLGIDIGSAASKAAVMEDGKYILALALHKTGVGLGAAQTVLDEVLRRAGCGMAEIRSVVATGYGRNMLQLDCHRISELSCHARGAHFLAPETRTLIDVGGQDAKVIRMDDRGHMLEFMMNDKCAAGTGRFIEVMAHVLGCQIHALSDLAGTEETVHISSTCTVFAETEVISHLAAGVSREQIAGGIARSVAKRVAGLAMRCGVVPKVMMSGGVAQNKAVVRMLGEELRSDIFVPEECQYCGAIGAAILAREKAGGAR